MLGHNITSTPQTIMRITRYYRPFSFGRTTLVAENKPGNELAGRHGRGLLRRDYDRRC